MTAIGDVLGPYRILNRIGAGAMGEVFLAEDPRLKRTVAIKTLLAAPGDQARQDALLLEARAAATLSHPSIASVFDVLDRDGRMHMVMEFVPGETLAGHLRHGALPLPRVLDIGRQLADALAYAHGRGVRHCDLKPGNIVVTPEGRAKILDFGLARVASAIPSDVETPGAFVRGTPAYIAPELLSGAPPTDQSDIYSLGVTLYEVTTGRRPYQAADFHALVHAVHHEPPPRPSSIVGDLPEGLEDVIGRAMARDPASRYTSASSVRDDLERVIRRSMAATTHTSAAERRSRTPVLPNRRKMVLIPLLLAAVITGLVAMLRSSQGPGRVAAPAVLAVLSDAPDVSNGEALSRGFADSAADALQTLSGLTIATSAEAVGPPTDVTAAGRRLGASHLLVARVRDADGEMHLSLRLMTLSRDTLLWSRDVIAGRTHLLSTQRRLIEEAMAAVVQHGLGQRPVGASLLPDATMTTNLDAYAEFTQARVFESRPDVPGNLDRALALYERAVRREPEFAEAHAGIGRVSLALYDATRVRAWVDRAQKSTLEALRLAPTSAAVRYAVAVLYRQTGRESTAREELAALIRQHPEHDDAHRLMGRLLAEAGDLPKALEELETARKLRPGYWDNYRALGLAYFDAGRYADAVAAFQRLTELQPDSPWGFQSLGTAYHAGGNRFAALENYRRAIALAPSARSYSNIGTLLYEDGRFQEAVDAYRQAIALRPNQPMTHRNLGDALRRTNRVQDAAAAYRASVALVRAELDVKPDDADNLALEAYCVARLGQLTKAIELSARAAALSPSNYSVMYERAVIFVLADEPCPALEWLEKAIAAGYSQSLAANDTDLRRLAGHPRFDAVVGPTQSRGAWAGVTCAHATT